MARRGPEGYGLVQPPLMGRDARRPSRTESFAKLMPAIPFAQGGEYFSSSAGWQQRLAYTFTVLLFAVACVVVVFSSWLEPPCDEDAARAIYPKHDAPFSTGQQKGDARSLQRECSARARSGKSIHASRPSREMIARREISRSEWKTTERGAV